MKLPFSSNHLKGHDFKDFIPISKACFWPQVASAEVSVRLLVTSYTFAYDVISSKDCIFTPRVLFSLQSTPEVAPLEVGPPTHSRPLHSHLIIQEFKHCIQTKSPLLAPTNTSSHPTQHSSTIHICPLHILLRIHEFKGCIPTPRPPF